MKQCVEVLSTFYQNKKLKVKIICHSHITCILFCPYFIKRVLRFFTLHDFLVANLFHSIAPRLIDNCDVSDGSCGSSTRNVFCGEKHTQQEQFKCTAVIGYSIKRYQDAGTESKQEAVARSRLSISIQLPPPQPCSHSHLNNQNSARGPSLTLTHTQCPELRCCYATERRRDGQIYVERLVIHIITLGKGSTAAAAAHQAVWKSGRTRISDHSTCSIALNSLAPKLQLLRRSGSVGIFFSFCECVNTLIALWLLRDESCLVLIRFM